MARVVYVRERVKRAIKTRLETITVANGYATTVLAVKRQRGFQSKMDDAYSIWMQFGTTTFEHRGGGLLDEIVPMALTFAWPSTAGDPDTEYSAFVGDIQKALQTSGKFYVPFTSTAVPNTREIQVQLQDDDAEWTETIQVSLCLGMLVGELRYSRMISNPAKWDSNDVQVSE